MMARLLGAAVLVAVAVVCVSGGREEEFPDPRRQWRMCGRTRPSAVCDPDFILERSQAERLDQISEELRAATSCVCSECREGAGGAVAGVFLARNLSARSVSKYPKGNDVAEMLRRRWGMSACDGDIVIVIITQLNMTGYSAGHALTPLLPVSTTDQIMSACSGHFDSGYHYQGLESVLNSVRDALVSAQRAGGGPFVLRNMALGMGLGFGVMLVLALFALAMLHRRQVMRRESKCETIYSPERRRPSFNQEEHLEKMRRLSDDGDEDSDDDDDDEEAGRWRRRPYRQLSDVPEASTEEEARHAGTPRGSVPVTEL